MALPSYEEYQKQFEQRKAQQETELAELGYKRVGNKYVKVPTEQEAYSDQLTTMGKEQSYFEGTPEGIRSRAMVEAEAKSLAEQKYPAQRAPDEAAKKGEQFVVTLLKQLQSLSSRVNTSSFLPSQYLRSWKSSVAPDSDPDAAELATKKAFLAPLVRQLGEKGNLSDNDIQRAINAIPAVTDTKVKAQRKMKALREFFAKPEVANQQSATGRTSGRFQIVEE